MDYVEENNPPDDYGNTPLHLAAKEGHLDVCRLIMDQVEDKHPRNDAGETPLKLALNEGHYNIAELFRAKRPKI